MTEFATTELHTTDDPHWLFNLDELKGSRLGAVSDAKSAVADKEDIRYRYLRGRKVNPNGLLDEYVVVVKVK